MIGRTLAGLLVTSRRRPTARSGTPRSARARSASSIRHRRGRAGAARRGLGAARRDRRPGRRGLDHRRRAERDRPRRSRHAGGRRVRCPRTAATPTSTPPPSTATAGSGSPARTASTAASTRRAARCEVRRAAGPRALRDHRDARRRDLLRLARRQPHRRIDLETGAGDRDRAADTEPGRGASGPTRKGSSGSANGTRPGEPSTTRTAAPGESGGCRATSPRPTRSTSTTRTSSG